MGTKIKMLDSKQMKRFGVDLEYVKDSYDLSPGSHYNVYLEDRIVTIRKNSRDGSLRAAEEAVDTNLDFNEFVDIYKKLGKTRDFDKEKSIKDKGRLIGD